MRKVILIFFFISSLYLAVLYYLDTVLPGSYKATPVKGTKILQLSDGQIRFQDSGEGNEAILFLHGFNAQLAHWNRVWRKTNNCARIIRLDIPGFGDSDNWRTDSFTLSAQAARIIEFINILGITRVTLVGVSMGGSLSAWIAAHYPERVNGLVLLAPSGYTNSLSHRGLYGYLIKPGILNKLAFYIVNSGLYKALFPNSRGLQALSVTSSYGENWVRELKNIRSPTIILWSINDHVVPVKYARAINNKIKNSLLIPLGADVRHNIPHARPELIANISCQIQQGTDIKNILNNIKQHLIEKGDQ